MTNKDTIKEVMGKIENNSLEDKLWREQMDFIRQSLQEVFEQGRKEGMQEVRKIYDETVGKEIKSSLTKIL